MINFRLILEHDNKYQSGDWNEYIKDFIYNFLNTNKSEDSIELTDFLINNIFIQYLDWKQEQDVISPRELLIDTIQNLCNNLPNVYTHLDYTAEDYLNKSQSIGLPYLRFEELESLNLGKLRNTAEILLFFIIKNPFNETN